MKRLIVLMLLVLCACSEEKKPAPAPVEDRPAVSMTGLTSPFFCMKLWNGNTEGRVITQYVRYQWRTYLGGGSDLVSHQRQDLTPGANVVCQSFQGTTGYLRVYLDPKMSDIQVYGYSTQDMSMNESLAHRQLTEKQLQYKKCEKVCDRQRDLFRDQRGCVAACMS